jgi:hypothetical protein
MASSESKLALAVIGAAEAGINIAKTTRAWSTLVEFFLRFHFILKE